MEIPHHGLDSEDVQRMIKGNYKFQKCLHCDVNGVQYWDSSTGEGVNSSPVGIPKENLDYGACEECNGYGYYLIFD